MISSLSLDERRRLATMASGAVLLVGVALPSNGAGVPVCPCRLFTGVPCPGCGLTRSATCFLHADLASSVTYHPFGPAVCLLLMGVVAWGIMPRNPRERIGTWAIRHNGLLRCLLGAFFASIVVFGIGRAAGWFPDHTADTVAIARST